MSLPTYSLQFVVLQELRVGDRVRVTGGPFEGYEGVFDARLSGADRVRVLLELIGEFQLRSAQRAVSVELNVGNITRLSA